MDPNSESMEKYGLDPSWLSMEWFYGQLASKRLLPGRARLREEMAKRFGLLEKRGIKHLGELIRTLGSKQKIEKVAVETGIPRDYLVLLKREAGSYLAKPFPLSDFPGIPFEYTESLGARGIRNTRDFFESVQTDRQREEVSSLTGIPANRLKEIFSLCDLSRISGVGPLLARILRETGISSVKDFASTDPDILNEKYPRVIERHGYPPKPLAEDDIRYCMESARLILEMQRDTGSGLFLPSLSP